MVPFRTIVQQLTNYYRHKSMLFPEITTVKMVFKYKINLGQPLFCVDKTMFCNYFHHSKESVFFFQNQNCHDDWKICPIYSPHINYDKWKLRCQLIYTVSHIWFDKMVAVEATSFHVSFDEFISTIQRKTVEFMQIFPFLRAISMIFNKTFPTRSLRVSLKTLPSARNIRSRLRSCWAWHKSIKMHTTM